MRYIILSSLALIILSCGSSFGTNYDDKISELEDLVSNLESQVYDNESRISNLEWEVSSAKSMIEDLEFNSY